ncbi:MAG: class I SAM-dependent methyltransferase [Proteobacteria bacterium]|nr:class I SAM-dependent methyltransferase [Pseudomonadota bacterium]MCP4920193.1 class I SAM-dependent methyltransferase [Pseudomonadota bacterium]
MSDSPWWASRFAALAAIDPAFAGALDRHAEAQVDLLEQLLDLRPGEAVVDVGCGGGRHSILLHERGYNLTGVDISSEVLDVARSRWRARHAEDEGPGFLEGDMRELPVAGPFAAAILMDESLGVFDDDADHLRTLSGIADVVRPGGRLVIELFNPYFWSHRHTTQHLPPGSLAAGVDVVRTYRFDPIRGRVEDRAVVFDGTGRRELPTQSLRCWTPPEVLTLASASGFSAVEIFGSDGWKVPARPVRLDARTSAFMWVVATL